MRRGTRRRWRRAILVESFEVADENLGGDEQALDFRTLNLKLLPATQDLAGYEHLPIARFHRDAAANNAPRLDAHYIPPLLACDAWRPLAVDILQASFHRLGGHVEHLAGRSSAAASRSRRTTPATRCCSAGWRRSTRRRRYCTPSRSPRASTR